MKTSEKIMPLTITIKQLSYEINLSVKTIRTTLVKNPTALPPRLIIEGQKKLLWLWLDVEDFYQRQHRAHGSNPRFSTKASVQINSELAPKRGRPTKSMQIKKRQSENI